MSQFLILISIIVLNSHVLCAKEAVQILFNPYLMMQTGDYTIGSVDEGNFSAAGIGSKLGASIPWLWVGLEGTLISPSFTTRISGVDRTTHPLPDGDMLYSYGFGFMLKLGQYFRISFTNFLKQKLTTQISSGSSSGNYTYHGSGQKIGVDISFDKKLHFFFESYSSSFAQYELTTDVGNSDAANVKTNRTPLDIGAFAVGIGYRIGFGSLSSFR